MSAMEFFYTNSPTSQRTTHGEMLSRTAGSPLHLTQFDHGISNHFYEYSQRPQPPVDFSFVEQLGMDATSVTCSNSNTFIPTNQSTEYCAASFFPPAAPGQVAGSHWSTSFDQGCQGQIYETPVGRGITGASGPAPNSIPGVLISYSDTGNYTSNVRNEASNHVIEPSQVLLRSNEEEHQLSQPDENGTYRCLWPGCKDRNGFKRDLSLWRHIKAKHLYPQSFECPFPPCEKRFDRVDSLRSHQQMTGHHSATLGTTALQRRVKICADGEWS